MSESHFCHIPRLPSSCFSGADYNGLADVMVYSMLIDRPTFYNSVVNLKLQRVITI